MLQYQHNGGNMSTQTDLMEAQTLINCKGTPIEISHSAHKVECLYVTTLSWHCTQMSFHGFTCGYYGEGCRGLVTLLRLCNIHATLDMIANLRFVNDRLFVSFYPFNRKMVYGWEKGVPSIGPIFLSNESLT